ncbi:MAG: hypothetical protein ABSH32_18790 [Bryobacteraceae bacterium]
MDPKELVPLGKEVYANLTIEELESRLEMTFVSIDTDPCCQGGGCLNACCRAGGCLGQKSTQVDDLTT